MPHNLERLRDHNLGKKRSLAQREFALGIEALERFVAGESLHRVHMRPRQRARRTASSTPSHGSSVADHDRKMQRWHRTLRQEFLTGKVFDDAQPQRQAPQDQRRLTLA